MGWLDDLNLDIDPSDTTRFEKWEKKINALESDRRSQFIPKDRIHKSPLQVRKEYIEAALSSLDVPDEIIHTYARRMIRNWDYDPTDPALSYWDDKCHHIYATKGLDERDREFRKIVRYWATKKKILANLDSEKGLRYLERAREMADEGKFKYEDWVLAQAIHYPRCYMKYLVYRKAPEITRQWIRGGRYRPALFKI